MMRNNDACSCGTYNTNNGVIFKPLLHLNLIASHPVLQIFLLQHESG